jgi:DNA-binding transcriptional LysR family regulator
MIARDLAEGATDLAIDAPLQDTVDLMQRTLLSERYVCALRPGQPAAGERLDLDRYLSLGHVHVSSRRHGAGPVDHALKALGYKRRVKVRLQNYLSAPEIVLNSDLSVTLTENFARGLGFETLDLPFDVPRLEFKLYWHRMRHDDPTNLWLRELVLAPFDHSSIGTVPD